LPLVLSFNLNELLITNNVYQQKCLSSPPSALLDHREMCNFLAREAVAANAHNWPWVTWVIVICQAEIDAAVHKLFSSANYFWCPRICASMLAWYIHSFIRSAAMVDASRLKQRNHKTPTLEFYITQLKLYTNL